MGKPTASGSSANTDSTADDLVEQAEGQMGLFQERYGGQGSVL